MYHKQPDKADVSLKDWINESKFDHVEADYNDRTSFSIIDQIETNTANKCECFCKQEDTKEMTATSNAEECKEEIEENVIMARPTNNELLANKLTDEKEKIQDKLLKLDSKIINPIGISDYQVKLLKVQRNAMMTVHNVLDLRIDDLKTDK